MWLTNLFTIIYIYYLDNTKAPISKQLMMSKKVFVLEYSSTLILYDETKYHTFRALCLEQSSSRPLMSSYLQAILCFFNLCYLGYIHAMENPFARVY